MRMNTQIQRVFTTMLLVAVVACFAAGSALAGKVAIDKGTKIDVRFDLGAKISSKTSNVGDTVNITLAAPIIIGGQVIVDEGAEGKAVVADIKKNGKVGKPGEITINFVSLNAKGAFSVPNGGVIPLTGSISDRGKGKKILSILFIAGLLIKGGNGEIDTGKAYPATVAESVILEN